MKATINKESFQKSLAMLSKTVPIRPTTPVLNNVLVKAQEGGLEITGTNLDTTIKDWLPAKVTKKGEVTVPIRILAELVNSLKEDRVSIELDKETVIVTTSNTTAKIPTIAATEFPTIQEPSKHKEYKVPKVDFTKAVKEVITAASQDEARMVLTGVLFTPGKDGALLVTTDGYRLAKKKTKLPLKEELIMPARDLAEIAKIAAGSEEEEVVIKVPEGNNQVGFTIGHTSYYTKLIAGEFPNYEQIIPKEFVASVKLVKEEFLEALRTATAFAKDLGNVVHLYFDEKKSFVRASSSATGESEVTLEAETSGQVIDIAFNSRYLSEGVGAITGDKIEIKFGGEVNPALIKSPTDESLIYIVMPVRTQT